MRPGLSKTMARMIGRYEFEVGIIDDKPHKLGKYSGLFEAPDLKVYAGGPARKTTPEKSGLSIAEVFVQNQERLNTDLLKEPFERAGSDVVKLAKEYLNLTLKQIGSIKRVENLVQAVVRNPILRGDYGNNRAVTADNKGFDRHLIDTAQMFKAIKARAKVKSRV